ncbi:MAG: TIGR03790 family protein [Phycisphaerae bacterium]
MKKIIPRTSKPEGKKIKNKYLLIFILFFSSAVLALEPAQILVIANSDVNESIELANYYCKARAVPAENILKIPLGIGLSEQMSRQRYDNVFAAAVRNELTQKRPPGQIKCLLTLYGVPLKVASAGAIKNSEQIIPKLTETLDAKNREFKIAIHRLSQLGRAEMADPNPPPEKFEDALKSLPEKTKQAEKRIQYLDNADERTKQLAQLSELSKRISSLANAISTLRAEIDKCKGIETSAAVDSELSMVLCGDYDLYRWQKNELQNLPSWMPAKTLMVCRLDSPSLEISKGLIDKAISAEKIGLAGNAYIDKRYLKISDNPVPYSYEYYDRCLSNLAEMLRRRTNLKVVVNSNESLFPVNSCKKTALYCGWYSVKKYIDAFEFIPGAVGFHIASFEAQDLRNASSSNWCPALLTHGITATIGPVDEPYLNSFPEPDKFFAELLDGKTLIEAFYRTSPFNSWQLILIGDPLYTLNIK